MVVSHETKGFGIHRFLSHEVKLGVRRRYRRCKLEAVAKLSEPDTQQECDDILRDRKPFFFHARLFPATKINLLILSFQNDKCIRKYEY